MLPWLQICMNVNVVLPWLQICRYVVLPWLQIFRYVIDIERLSLLTGVLNEYV